MVVCVALQKVDDDDDDDGDDDDGISEHMTV
jgi:hypothetical protein